MSKPALTVHVVDDDEAFRDSLLWLLDSHGYPTRGHDSAEALLGAISPAESACLIADVRMPGLSGLELLDEMRAQGLRWPVIFITGHGDLPMAVQALRQGAFDFHEKPFDQAALFASVDRALALAAQQQAHAQSRARVDARLESLTQREREVLDMVVQGKMNKLIADALGISIKTVEVHRGKMMDKMQVRSVAELIHAVMSVADERVLP